MKTNVVNCGDRTHFRHLSGPVNFSVPLPILLVKFMQPATMDQSTFFSRWKLLCQPDQESQRAAPGQMSVDPEEAKQRILGSGLSLLPGIDPCPTNFVGAGIVHTTAQQIGVLARIEPSTLRVTVRSTKSAVSDIVCSLLMAQLQ
nr:unnamed protein product [Spirometra erinaceieuropaei]